MGTVIPTTTCAASSLLDLVQAHLCITTIEAVPLPLLVWAVQLHQLLPLLLPACLAFSLDLLMRTQTAPITFGTHILPPAMWAKARSIASLTSALDESMWAQRHPITLFAYIFPPAMWANLGAHACRAYALERTMGAQFILTAFPTPIPPASMWAYQVIIAFRAPS